MRCSYKLLPAVPTVCKRACLATLSKKTLLEEIQAKELVAHWEQDCPCHPPQGAPFCEVLENLAHRIYQPLQWNESLFPVALLTQPTDTLRHHLAFGTRRHRVVYTHSLASEDQEEQTFLPHLMYNMSFFSMPYSCNTGNGTMEKRLQMLPSPTC